MSATKRYRFFSKLLNELRLKAGILTLQDLAVKSGLAMSTINNYSRGQDLPGKSKMYPLVIAQALGVEVSILNEAIEKDRSAGKT